MHFHLTVSVVIFFFRYKNSNFVSRFEKSWATKSAIFRLFFVWLFARQWIFWVKQREFFFWPLVGSLWVAFAKFFDAIKINLYQQVFIGSIVVIYYVFIFIFRKWNEIKWCNFYWCCCCCCCQKTIKNSASVQRFFFLVQTEQNWKCKKNNYIKPTERSNARSYACARSLARPELFIIFNVIKI